jgi:hypothetical protein
LRAQQDNTPLDDEDPEKRREKREAIDRERRFAKEQAREKKDELEKKAADTTTGGSDGAREVKKSIMTDDERAAEEEERRLQAEDEAERKKEADYIHRQKLNTAIATLCRVGGPNSSTKQKRQAAMGFAQCSLEEEGQQEIALFKVHSLYSLAHWAHSLTHSFFPIT